MVLVCKVSSLRIAYFEYKASLTIYSITFKYYSIAFAIHTRLAGGLAQELELQSLAHESQLTVAVCHFPPGTSKWNKIEHRMFSHITKNWRG